MKHVLTDEEIDSVETEVLVDLIGTQFDVYRAIEAKILEKIGEAKAWQNKYLPNSFYTNDNLNPQWGLDDMTPLYAIPFIEGEE